METGPETSVPRIAARLRATRAALGLSQVELCRRAAIGTSAYNQWEHARGRPELDKGIALCEAFGLTLDWIYRGVRGGLPHDVATRISEQGHGGRPSKKAGRRAQGSARASA